MSYEESLKAAGAEVLEFCEFGSYQGDWWAKVRYNGEVGWVQGSYGSCSGCDAFLSEFGWADQDCIYHRYHHQDSCAACVEAKKKYDERLADFGKTYLDGLMTQEQAEEAASVNLDWDDGAADMLKWIKEHSVRNT